MTVIGPGQVAAELRRLADTLDPPTGARGVLAVSLGAQMIADERARQIHTEGHDPTNDLTHKGNELAWGAFCYLERAAQQRLPQGDPSIPHVWPWDRRAWKPKDTVVRNLTVAAALIAAEIDRRTADGSTTP